MVKKAFFYIFLLSAIMFPTKSFLRGHVVGIEWNYEGNLNFLRATTSANFFYGYDTKRVRFSTNLTIKNDTFIPSISAFPLYKQSPNPDYLDDTITSLSAFSAHTGLNIIKILAEKHLSRMIDSYKEDEYEQLCLHSAKEASKRLNAVKKSLYYG